MLRDRYIAIDEKTCYPTLMTAPYEGKYYKFYWGFDNNQLEERSSSKEKDTIKFYKLHLNEIKFATDSDNFRDEKIIYLFKEKVVLLINIQINIKVFIKE